MDEFITFYVVLMKNNLFLLYFLEQSKKVFGYE